LLRTLHLLIILVLIASVTIIAGCQGESNEDTFPEVGQSLSKSIKQIDKQPGILLTGFAADPKVKRYKVGIEYDPVQISNEQLKQIVTDYLSHAASNKFYLLRQSVLGAFESSVSAYTKHTHLESKDDDPKKKPSHLHNYKTIQGAPV